MNLRSTIIIAVFCAAIFRVLPASAELFIFPALQNTTPGDPEQLLLSESRTVVIYGSADIEAFRPAIDGFQQSNPEIRVEYHQLQTLEMYHQTLAEREAGEPNADLVISSSMDLQMKLANDGYAFSHQSDQTRALPNWARWRNEAFAVTQEPAVMAYNRKYFRENNLEPPRTRNDFIRLLNDHDDLLSEKVTTYDIERSGVGFLFLARDERFFSGIWDFVRTLGQAKVKLYSNTSPMLEKIADGQLVLGYNLLGSYAETFSHRNPNLGVILPDDFIVVYSRIAIIPRGARNPELGGRFLDYILSIEGQSILQDEGNFNPVRPDVPPSPFSSLIFDRYGERVRSFPVGPGLLVYLDQAKRQRFLSRWQDALLNRR
ncbi:iron ABC transporter substrate-binding protein [Thalassospira lucentensis]|uniref:Iron(III) transport system substrate-binding protein n=2 Tax=Thalassospira TaxID=168934 RepID=A0A285T5Z8_9PROT|nr:MULTISPECIES: ABC transporter substrate-binding protein [Thalassospira]KZB66901.1 iron ABC transporter substrate-binding protein [Thalassospira lucentensis]MBO9506735.1 ABC transporter substrate-binding protein [Thalassospira sp. A3_1]MCH2273539.1 ABC transporter substrate-binding protein [Thalassospira sp.]RCK35533.1 iron ABC transporter substrate-binding protein [Thalassospira xiamenensis]WOI12344.1 ABC transporter substrate-binding protein [Thalassospira lucentensis]